MNRATRLLPTIFALEALTVMQLALNQKNTEHYRMGAPNFASLVQKQETNHLKWLQCRCNHGRKHQFSVIWNMDYKALEAYWQSEAFIIWLKLARHEYVEGANPS